MQNTEILRYHVSEIIFGTIFLAVGLTAAGIALIRRGKGFRILAWLAVWSGLYGFRLLILSSPVRVITPQVFSPFIPYIDVTISYLILVFALLAWLDLTRGSLRIFMKVMILTGLLIGLAGIIWFVFSGERETFMLYNQLLAACTLLAFIIVVTVRQYSEKFLILPNRGILAAGTLLFTAEALYSNLSRLFGYETLAILGWLGFAALLFSLAFVSAQMLFASERRLIKIDYELGTARKIQSSILPDKVPEINGLSIAAAYYPMNAVAGDFYEFVEINEHQTGILVADVSGHGIPAALIASMIKVAMQSVTDSGENPGEVLRLLNTILGKLLHDGQYITAAYLVIDSKYGQARYSAAGHPPMLYWDSAAQKAQFIESNGIVLGFIHQTDYPVRELSFKKGDRFFIYTDGLTEAENPDGEFFSDYRLSELIRLHENTPAEELNEHILEELGSWMGKRPAQQDDLTWVVVDVG
jgi:phosphoserine phosphatase RsbU/P